MAGPAFATTFDAAPSVLLPSGTQYIDIKGKAVAGDFGDASYRAVATEPSHPGKLKVGDQWFELFGRFCTPDQFLRTGDADDAASFQRANAYMFAKGITTLQLAPRIYTTLSSSVSFDIAAQIIGSGFTESGKVGNINANNSTSGDQARGTWINAGRIGEAAFKFNVGGARGSLVDRLGFVQAHPTAAPNWQPTLYDYIIEANGAKGGIEVGDVMFLGINKGVRSYDSGRLYLRRMRGQFFTNAVDIDLSLDVCSIDNFHNWPFLSNDTNIRAYQCQFLRLITLGRVDGLFAQKIFSYWCYACINAQMGRSGAATDIDIDSLYSDAGCIALYVESPNSLISINTLTSQSENTAAAGSALPGSSAIRFAESADGGLLTVGRFRAERYSVGAVVNASNSTMQIGNSAFLRDSPTAPQQFRVIAKPNTVPPVYGPPVFIQYDPILDSTTSNLGDEGRDYAISSKDISNTWYSTTDAAGSVVYAHNLGGAAAAAASDAFAVVRGNSGEAVPMTLAYVDGTNIKFDSSAAYANRPVRITYRRRRLSPPW
jgi:hypothetical protein